MEYNIFDAETDCYIISTKNKGKDPMKECCFENGVLYLMYVYANEHTDLNGLTFSQFCDECRTIERYIVADVQKYDWGQLKDILRNQACSSNLYGHFILVPKIEEKEESEFDFYIIDIVDNNSRFSVPVAFFKTYEEAKKFVKNFEGNLKLKLEDIKGKKWTKN